VQSSLLLGILDIPLSNSGCGHNTLQVSMDLLGTAGTLSDNLVESNSLFFLLICSYQYIIDIEANTSNSSVNIPYLVLSCSVSSDPFLCLIFIYPFLSLLSTFLSLLLRLYFSFSIFPSVFIPNIFLPNSAAAN
jgi:hypothetical protein